MKKLMLSQDMEAVSCHFREEQALLSALPLVSLEKKLFERSKYVPAAHPKRHELHGEGLARAGGSQDRHVRVLVDAGIKNIHDDQGVVDTAAPHLLFPADPGHDT